MKPVLCALALLACALSASAECCGATTVEYSLPEGVRRCDEAIPYGEQKEYVDNDGVVGDILSKLDRRHKKCWIAVCNDGRWHEGSYCGVGKCNVFGCNCDGGCFGNGPADAFPKFMERHGHNVKSARPLQEYENWLP